MSQYGLSESPIKATVIQKLCSQSGSTRSMLTSKSWWPCFFTLPSFVQAMSPVLQAAAFHPAFLDVKSRTAIACATELTQQATTTPTVLYQSSQQDRDLPTEYCVVLAAGKYCQNNYQLLFINVDIHSLKKVSWDYQNHKRKGGEIQQRSLGSLRTRRFIPCRIPSSPWGKTSKSLPEWSYFCCFR